MFGSDEFADFGNVPVFRFDAGADSYEQMQFLISTYENRYIFNNFRRNRVTFNTDAVVIAAAGPLLRTRSSGSPRRSPSASSSSRSPASADPTTQAGIAHADGARLGRRSAMFVRAMTRPAPGTYVINARRGPGGHAEHVGRRVAARRCRTSTTPPPSAGQHRPGQRRGPLHPQRLRLHAGLLVVGVPDAGRQLLREDPRARIPDRGVQRLHLELGGRLRRRPVQEPELHVALPEPGPPPLRQPDGDQQRDPGQLSRGRWRRSSRRRPTRCPASDGSNAANPLTTTQYLPWDKYDPTDPTTTEPARTPPGAVLLDPLIGWEEQYPGAHQPVLVRADVAEHEPHRHDADLLAGRRGEPLHPDERAGALPRSAHAASSTWRRTTAPSG